ncbi:MOSC domain-containing protein [bacterium]|nr:MAG: MOSC domain-containing protein [bacterium]
MGLIRAINISPKKGTVKVPVNQAMLRPEHGIVGDAHAGSWHRQVSLLPHESIEAVRAQLPDLADGAFAENIVTEGLDLASVAIGDRIRAGQAMLEVTQIGKECHNGCVIREVTGDCIMPREGVFCRVLEGGSIAPGSSLRFMDTAAG